jgi:hypothetical protein
VVRREPEIEVENGKAKKGRAKKGRAKKGISRIIKHLAKNIFPDFRRDVTKFYPRMNTEETILTTKDTKHAKKKIIQAYVFDTLVYERINESTIFREYCDFCG